MYHHKYFGCIYLSACMQVYVHLSMQALSRFPGLNAFVFCAQANPSDPDNFPFVVLGNKVDIDSGNSRVVCAPTHIHYQCNFQNILT